ncbi:hypothetical protein CDD82_3624 [Ophiocordyceps australis]|uniref:Mitochondrial intermembrane space import and assembly protein 40 n=1 Tax=Ophiocordyceps australis TaxID=1399860 RepID=A0A2C5Y5D5_9HYPO|nr:hypothetical protein CDD82_3624 [Ophiocordyceps australis]
MYRTAVRSATRPLRDALPRTAGRSVARRFASTASPAHRPRSWKSSVLRWALAFGAVYFYNTSSIFSDESQDNKTIPPLPTVAEPHLPTVDAIIEQKRKELESKAAKQEPQKPSDNKAQQASSTAAFGDAETGRIIPLPPASPQDDQEESQEGAFNPETGEINWDCPCLGGMAQGPCGEEFKTAFSCFVYSEADPKGMDCVEKFQGMQECFRKYPEVYGAELADEDEDEDDAEAVGAGGGDAEDYQQLRQDSPAYAKDYAKPNAPSQGSSDDVPVQDRYEDARASNNVVKNEEPRRQEETKSTAQSK